MDIIDRAANLLLGRRGETYCDRCIGSSLALDRRREVQEVINALAESASFQRRCSTCCICGRETIVIGLK